MDNEKLNRLAERCSVLVSDRSIPPIADIYEYTRADAAALARELFPVKAKPLVWRNEGHGSGIISQDILRQRYDISPLRDNFLLHFGDDSSSERIGARFDTIEGAKAAAQSHHQARFLELLT